MSGVDLHALAGGADNGGLAGGAIVVLVVIVALGTARRFSASVARVGSVLAVVLVIAVALSASGLVTR